MGVFERWMALRTGLVALCAAGGMACGSTAEEVDASAMDAGSRDAALPPSAPDGPRIISLSTNVTELTEGGELVISAVVTDPDGVDDVIGGQLFNHPGTAALGAFTAPSSEGAYELRLSWAAIDAAQTIDAESGGVARELRAEFFDQAGHVAAEVLSVHLVCASRSDGICGGVCVDLQTSADHCGECGRAADGPGQACVDGALGCEVGELCDGSCVDVGTDPDNCGGCGVSCAASAGAAGGMPSCQAGDCFAIIATEVALSCADVCAAAGATCDPAGRTHCREPGGAIGCADYGTDRACTMRNLACEEAASATVSRNNFCAVAEEPNPVPLLTLRCACALE